MSESASDQGHLDRQQIFALIRDSLAEILPAEPDSIHEGDSFTDDLGADSLALIQLVDAIESELDDRGLGFRFDDDDLEDLKTVRDAVDYVHARVGGS